MKHLVADALSGIKNIFTNHEARSKNTYKRHPIPEISQNTLSGELPNMPDLSNLSVGSNTTSDSIENLPKALQFLLPLPKSWSQRVLLHLIQKGPVSCYDFSIPSFRTIISDFKIHHGLTLAFEEKEVVGDFGKKFTYRLHILSPEQKDFAISIYQKLNKR